MSGKKINKELLDGPSAPLREEKSAKGLVFSGEKRTGPPSPRRQTEEWTYEVRAHP